MWPFDRFQSTNLKYQKRVDTWVNPYSRGDPVGADQCVRPILYPNFVLLTKCYPKIYNSIYEETIVTISKFKHKIEAL